MLDKQLIQIEYKNGERYANLARKYHVSRQRIHQIVQNYNSFTYCICKKKAILVHHEDHICKDCHKIIKTKESVVVRCTVCRNFTIYREKSFLLRKGHYKCSNCRKYEKIGKHKHIRDHEKSKYCIQCKMLFNKENPYYQKNMCIKCFGKFRYKNDLHYREYRRQRDIRISLEK